MLGGCVIAAQRLIQALLASFTVRCDNLKLDLVADSACDGRIDRPFRRHRDQPQDSVPKHQRQLFFAPWGRAWKHGIAH